MKSLRVYYAYVKIPQCGDMKHGLNYIECCVHKHKAPRTICYNRPLVRDKPLLRSTRILWNSSINQLLEKNAMGGGGGGGGGRDSPYNNLRWFHLKTTAQGTVSWKTLSCPESERSLYIYIHGCTRSCQAEKLKRPIMIISSTFMIFPLFVLSSPVMACLFIASMTRKYRQVDEIFITGCTATCHFLTTI